MSTRLSLPDGATLRAEAETIDCTSMFPTMEPDPAWSFTDSAGHVHTHSSNSFTWVYEGEEFWTDEFGEEYEGTGHYECNACAAEVRPRQRTKDGGMTRQVISGPRHYSLELADGTVEDLTEAQYLEIINGLRAEQRRKEDERGGIEPSTTSLAA